MTSQKMHIPERVSRWVEGWISRSKQKGSAVVEPLAGDGSLRSYYRLRLPDQTFVLLSDADWIFSRDYAPHQAYLSGARIPVPRFLEVDPASGFAVMDDLGDELLQERIRHLGPKSDKKSYWLGQAATLLAQLHGRTFPVPATLPAATRRFDAQKYFEELQFTFEHLHEKFLQLPPPSAEQLKVVRRFCERLDGLKPDVFCHRDYHTRNLLVSGEALFMIDFQDARLGPVQYDLASLLYDAYVPISDPEKRLLVDMYRGELRRYPLFAHVHWDSFDLDLKLVALQRVIKAAGSFASFFTRYGKRTHLPYLLPALESALQLQEQCFKPNDELLGVLNVRGWIDKARHLKLTAD